MGGRTWCSGVVMNTCTRLLKIWVACDGGPIPWKPLPGENNEPAALALSSGWFNAYC